VVAFQDLGAQHDIQCQISFDHLGTSSDDSTPRMGFRHHQIEMKMSFFSLPQELRYTIYDLAVPEKETKVCTLLVPTDNGGLVGVRPMALSFLAGLKTNQPILPLKFQNPRLGESRHTQCSGRRVHN
jgi:hypothetical protein